MNILIIVPWDQEFGGVASVVGNLAAYLRGKKHDVSFLHPGHQNIIRKKNTKWGFPGYQLRLRVPLVKGHSVRSLIAFLVFFPLTLLQIVYLLLSLKIDIVNVHYPSAEFFYSAICRRLLGIKLVTSIHGADFFPAGKPRENIPICTRFLLSSSDCIIAPSNSFLLDFMNLFPSLRTRGHFIHNGINIAEMNPLPQKEEHKDGNKYLLCIAAQNEKKGIDVLLHAFSKIRADHSSLQLLLVGDGPLRKKHKEMADALGLQNGVRFLGDRGRQEVVKLLHGCELLVLPSRAEPFGIAVIEAMACRKPVVATRVGGIPEIIEDGKSGILVEPDDTDSLTKAITYVLKDETVKAYLAANGYERVCANFLWEHAGAKYEKLFSSLSNGGQVVS
jgi:glycosyltransferase involved in cell wall biosynthesis